MWLLGIVWQKRHQQILTSGQSSSLLTESIIHKS